MRYLYSMNLLTYGNPKTIKGEKKGYLTFILHLAPHKLSGYNVCPMASAGCSAACLNTAGRGQMSKIQAARIRKTKSFFENRNAFLATLIGDIRRGIRYAEKRNLIPTFRLNGTSDIRWETIKVTDGGIEYDNIMALFPDIQFYDYTKLPNRENLPPNYHLTFSRSEDNTVNDLQAIVSNTNVAVVFNVKKGYPLPEMWIGVPVVDGDETDLRFLDPAGVFVGLRSKGKAKKDSHSNFVVTI